MKLEQCKTVGEIVEWLGEQDYTPNGEQREALQHAYRLGQESKWQPIDTEPKNGGKCLLFTTITSSDEAVRNGAPKTYTDIGIARYLSKAIGYSSVLGGNPTHWQPLLPPPVAKGE